MPTVRTDPYLSTTALAISYFCTDYDFTGCDKVGAAWDTAGNRYDLSNVSIKFSETAKKLTYTGQITPPSDITLDRVRFEAEKTIDTTLYVIAPVEVGDIGQSLSANVTYQIVLEVTLQVPSSF